MALKKMAVPSQGFNFVIFRGGEDWLVISLSQAAGRAAALSRGEHQPEKIVFSSLRKRGKKEFWLKKKRAARFQCLNFVGLFSGGEDWSACNQLACLAHCREETCCRQLNKLCLSFFLSSGEREKNTLLCGTCFFLFHRSLFGHLSQSTGSLVHLLSLFYSRRKLEFCVQECAIRPSLLGCEIPEVRKGLRAVYTQHKTTIHSFATNT